MIRDDPNSSEKYQTMLTMLDKEWSLLVNLAEEVGTRLEANKSDANNRGSDFEKWLLWLEDLLADLNSQKPIGGLPETAIAQLDEFSIMQADVDQRRPKLDAEIKLIEEQFNNESVATRAGFQEEFRNLCNNWALLQHMLSEREIRLQKALEDAIELYNGMQTLEEWLREAERQFAGIPYTSKLLDPLSKQLAEHNEFVKDVHINHEKMKDLYHKGGVIQLSCEKKDAIPIKNKVFL